MDHPIEVMLTIVLFVTAPYFTLRPAGGVADRCRADGDASRGQQFVNRSLNFAHQERLALYFIQSLSINQETGTDQNNQLP